MVKTATDLKIPDDDEEDDTSGIQVTEKEELAVQAVKKRPPKTAKQMESVQKMVEARKRACAERRAKKEEEEIEYKKCLEEKILKKAISIKKKQIKQQAIVEDISDDETPVDEIHKIVSRKPRIVERIVYVEPEPPRYRFI